MVSGWARSAHGRLHNCLAMCALAYNKPTRTKTQKLLLILLKLHIYSRLMSLVLELVLLLQCVLFLLFTNIHDF